MPVDPEDPSAFEAYFGVAVTRGPRFEVAFAPLDATRPFLTSDSSMWSFFVPVLRRRLAELDERTGVKERVHVALVELLPSGRRQIGDVARALGVSKRTIQRRLGEEGATYRGVLDDTRARLAQHYLTKTRLTTAEVAFLVGFDDPNSLYPAFRSWTGMTPRAARSADGPSD